MRIAHVITSTGAGGAERSLAHLRSRLAERGHRQLVVGLRPSGEMVDAITGAETEYVSLDARSPVRGVSRLPGLRRRLIAFRPDVVQSWMYHADLATSLVLKTIAHRPVHVWNVRGAARDFGQYPVTTRGIVRGCVLLSKLPDAVVVNSMSGKEFHEGIGYRPRRWAVIPNGFDSERFSPDVSARERIRAKFGFPSRARVVGWVGRAHAVKDFPLFLEAFARVIARSPDVRCVLAGRGMDPDNPEISRLVTDLGLADSVVAVGHQEDVQRLLSGLDLLCSSSRAEGMPNVVGEAMSCGVPCVVTDVGDSAFLVGETGIVVAPGDVQALAAGMVALLEEDPGDAAERRRSCRRRIVDNFDADQMVDRYLTLYLDLVEGGN